MISINFKQNWYLISFTEGRVSLFLNWMMPGEHHPFLSSPPRTPGKQGIETFKWLRPLIFSIKKDKCLCHSHLNANYEFHHWRADPLWDLYSCDKHVETENTPFQFGSNKISIFSTYIFSSSFYGKNKKMWQQNAIDIIYLRIKNVLPRWELSLGLSSILVIRTSGIKKLCKFIKYFD